MCISRTESKSRYNRIEVSFAEIFFYLDLVVLAVAVGYDLCTKFLVWRVNLKVLYWDNRGCAENCAGNPETGRSSLTLPSLLTSTHLQLLSPHLSPPLNHHHTITNTSNPPMAEHEAAVSFAEKVFTLSKFIHVRKFRNNVSAVYNRHQKKHLRLLDDIALLLVREPNSDVAAVAFEQQPKSVTFYYAKNRPSTPSEKAHIEQVLEIAKGPLDVDRIDLILTKVLAASRGKVLSRLAKLKAIIGKTSPEERCLRHDENGQVHLYLQKELGDWYVDYASPWQFLVEFLAPIENLAIGKCSTAEIIQIVSVAYSTGSYKPANAVFPDKELERRVRLLGDYFGAVRRIVKSVDSIRGGASPPALTSINFKEVSRRAHPPLPSIPRLGFALTQAGRCPCSTPSTVPCRPTSCPS